MPASPDDLFAFLDRLGIAHSTVWHAPMFTVEQSGALKADIPGTHTKNLFLKDAGGTLVLISAEAHAALDLNRLHKRIGTRRLSFGSAELMASALGVTPGSVTAFALMNDGSRHVRFLVDSVLAAADTVNFHPLANIATTSVSQAGFRQFVEATGHSFEIVDFAGA